MGTPDAEVIQDQQDPLELLLDQQDQQDRKALKDHRGLKEKLAPQDQRAPKDLKDRKARKEFRDQLETPAPQVHRAIRGHRVTKDLRDRRVRPGHKDPPALTLMLARPSSFGVTPVAPPSRERNSFMEASR